MRLENGAGMRASVRLGHLVPSNGATAPPILAIRDDGFTTYRPSPT